MSTDPDKKFIADWPQPTDFKRSIRFEFTVYVSAIVIAMMLITGYIVSDRYVNTVTRGVIDKMLTQARSYSGTAGKLIIGSTSPDVLLLSNTCKQLVRDNPDAYWAGISGRDDVYLAHTDIKHVLASKTSSELGADYSGDILREGEGIRITEDTIYISVEIVENDVKVGNLSVASSSAPVKDARRASIILIGLITAIVIAIGVPLTMFVLHRKLRPFGLIVDGLKSADVNNIRLDISLKTRNEFAYLAEALGTMGKRLNIAQKDLIQKERVAQELEIAREIQANLLPKAFPTHSHLVVCGTYRSALEVGGDYYDFLELDSDNLGFLVADVSGKSLPGMLVMLMTRDIVKQVARAEKSPKEILSEVNRELLENIRKGTFVTMFLGIISLKTGRIRYASAGHNPLLHLDGKTGDTTYIKTKGFPLGMMAPAVFDKRIKQSELNLKDGDLLIQYTDGVNEALNEAEEEYGLDRFAEFVRKEKALDPDRIIERFLVEHEQFVGNAAQYDDITMLAFKWIVNSPDNQDMEGRAVSDERYV